MAHTLAVNEVGAAFVRAARTRGDECDWTCWEHEVAHTYRASGPNRTLIADAVLTYTTSGGDQRRTRQYFVELDRATKPVDKLAAKVRACAGYRDWSPRDHAPHGLPAGGRAWRARYANWPTLLVVVGANVAKDHKAIERRLDQLYERCWADPRIRAALTGTDQLRPLACVYETLVARPELETHCRHPQAARRAAAMRVINHVRMTRLTTVLLPRFGVRAAGHLVAALAQVPLSTIQRRRSMPGNGGSASSS